MRLVLFLQSSVCVLLLASACTINNVSDSADSGAGSTETGGAGVGGASSGTGGAGGGANVAGASSVASGGSSVTSGSSIGGASPATGGTNSAGGGSGIGGTVAATGGNAAGGNAAGGSAAGGNTGVGGSAATTGGNATGGKAAGGNSGIGGSVAATGGNATGGKAAGGSSGIGGSVAATGGNATGGSSPGGASNVAGSGTLAAALPISTFVFERKQANGNDHLVAMDVESRQQRVITTLAEGSVTGWKIDGVTVSPDRTRIVLASPYGATVADNATGLSTNRLWNLDINGNDFRRITPVFPNTHAGQLGWHIDVRDPAFSPDGQYVVYDYGEGDYSGGYVAPWFVAADGSTLPSLISTSLDCSVNNNGVFNPVTGDLLLEHVVCIGGQKGGYFLYPNAGGAPDFLVNDDGISLSSEPPAFSADGSVFVYTGRTYSDNIQSLYAYSMSNRTVVPLIPGSANTDIINASFSPDDRYMVYCVKAGNLYDLRVMDFSADPPTDTELTSDGVSCDPVF